MNITNLKRDHDALRIENTDLKHRIRQLSKRRGKKELGKSKTDDDTPEDFVNQCARQYACLYFPWAGKSFVDCLKPEPPLIDPTDPLQRFSNPDSNVTLPLARQAEVHKLLSKREDVRTALGTDPPPEWISNEVRV